MYPGAGGGCGAGVVVGAGVGEQGGDGAGGVFGEATPDSDLVHLLVVQGVDAEGIYQGCFDAVGRVGQDGGGERQFVKQRGVVVLRAAADSRAASWASVLAR